MQFLRNDISRWTVSRFFGKLLLLILLSGVLPMAAYANGNAANDNGEKDFDARKVIVDHVLDSYEWHLFDVGDRSYSIHLPVILIYEGSFYVFLSSRFDHGQADHKGFAIASEGPRKGKAIRVLEDGKTPDPYASRIYDFSITKNVLAVFISSGLLCLLFIKVARSYRGSDIYSTPKAFRCFLNP